MADGARALRQFLWFAAVGTAGFVVDSGVLLAVAAVGVNLYVGRLISFLCAATFTYAANRRLTFRDSAGEPGAAQWARFVGANAVGGLANLGIYSWMIATAPGLPGQPVTAVAAGSLTGLLFNFALSRMFVFTARTR